MSVAEAASKLDVSERQVRRLAAEGELASHLIGRHRLIDADAVRERARSTPHSGRPLSPAMAWAVLAIAAAGIVDEEDEDPFRLAEERRARHRLRNLLAHAPPVSRWAHWLRRRAQPHRVWVHPGVLERFAADPRVRRGGGAAAAAAGIDVAVADRPILYVGADRFSALLAAYRAHEDPNGQVVVMVVPAEADDVAKGGERDATYLAAGLVDLLGSPDARERHGAEVALSTALARVLTTDRSGS